MSTFESKLNFIDRLVTIILFFNRALYVNFIGVASIISCACLSGIVLYAFYAKCDPLSRGVITSSDQVSFVISNESSLFGN